MKLRLFYIIFLISFSTKLFSYELKISGLDKLSIEDLQTFTDIDLAQKNFTSLDIDKLTNDFYLNDLIYEVDLSITENIANLTLSESKIIFLI